MRIALFVLFIVSQLNAQSFGIEYGISGTENYGVPENTIVLSFSTQLSEKVSGYVSYSQWSGEDGGYTEAKKFPGKYGSSGYYGNVGLNLSLHYKYYNTEDLNLYSGFGFGQYKMLNSGMLNVDYSYFASAFVLTPLFIEYEIGEQYSIYTKGLLGFKPNVIAPDWGSLTLGVSFNPF